MAPENLDDDAVVISGISGKFPNSNNINELIENLMNGVDCISDDHSRWPKKFQQVPSRIGIMPDITKLDNIFFGISSRLANSMDPIVRMLTSSVWEAIVDAGLNPMDVRGANIGVFASLSFVESDKTVLYEKYEPHGLGMLGSARTMASNRISFSMDFVGPSCTIQSACIGSAMALKKAIESIQSGECEAAIVDAGVLVLFPNISYQLSQLGLLASDGVNRSFDAKASGYTRSESIGVLFLQKAKDAKRIYAEISGANVMFGECTKDNTAMHNTAEFLAQIMKETLDQNGLKPSDITYIEADGSAIKKVDREELKAIDLVYGQDRSSSNPLLIGSIKSNIGHSSCTNTINSIIKVLIAMEKEVIPPNLHYEEPPEDANCLRDGRVKVVTKPTPWTDGYAAVNTTSYGGSFSHVILKRHPKNKKKKELSMNDIPRLCTMSVRNKEMLTEIFNALKKNYEDEEFKQLVSDLNEKPLNNSLFRGYILMPPDGKTNPEKIVEEIVPITEQSQEIWFVFSGMGSQWTGMGESLMKIPIFAEAIKKCDAVLKPRGYDIVKILCDKDPTTYNNIINCFLGIAAVQIGLVDILYAVGVKPNYMIGHSVGELGCSYADGCFTAEEMILSALSRGLASIESDLIHGSMAAVGLGYEQVKHLCPEDIDIACHNGVDSSTISGPVESVKAFVKELQEKGIFAKAVPSGNIAYHSRYIAPAGSKLLEYLKKVLPHPKTRSKRWLCTSVPKNEWQSDRARLSSAEYHTNNLLSSVLFEEVLTMLPNNAITIEIAPHGLLQAILKKSLHSDCVNLALTRRGHEDNTSLLLTTLGKLYNLGYPIALKELYPRIPYPVSKNTPLISPLVRWEHSTNWYVSFFEESNTTSSSQKTFMLDLKSDKYKYLEDFRIGNDIIIPLSVYLHFVQDIQLSLVKDTDQFFIFENIIIHNVLLKVPDNNILKLVIMVSKGSGLFEILMNNNIMIASGTITSTNMYPKEYPDVSSLKKEKQIYTREDFYTNLFMHGYEYGEFYKCVNRLSSTSSNGELTWNDSWVPLLEGLFQVQIFNSNNKHILMPSVIQKIVININEFKKETNEKKVVPMNYNKWINMIACTGIEMRGVEFTELTAENIGENLFMDEARFIPNVDETQMNMIDVCHIVLTLLSENICENTTRKIMLVQESASHDQDNISECFDKILETTKHNFEIKCVAKENLNQMLDEKFTLMIIDGTHFNDIRNIINNTDKESFLLIIVKMENQDKLIEALTYVGLSLILKKKIVSGRTVLLLRKVEDSKKPIVIKNQDNCIDQLKKSLTDSKYDKVIFLVNTITEKNVFETLRVLKQEPGYKKLQIFDLQNSKAPKFSLENTFYQNQIKLNLRQNVLSSDNVWGAYSWVPLSKKSISSSRWRANIEKSGSLTLTEELPLIKEKDKSIVKVEYAAFDLNIYEHWLDNDVSLDSQISITEYSGTDEKGRRVMGLVRNLTITNEIYLDPDFTWVIPNSLSFEDAAIMPQVYFAAFCILNSNKYWLTRTKTILIHFGASDLGQALINLSLSYKFDVYTTYETDAEKRVIQSIRPRIPDSHILSVDNYKHFLLDITNGKGMDFVVASYSILNDLESSLDVVRCHRNIVLVYNSKISNYGTFGTNTFLKDIRMYSYCLQDLMNLSVKVKSNVGELMKKALQAGTLKPLISRKLHFPKTTQEESKIEVNQHYGKVIVSPLKQAKSSLIVPSLCFDKDKCYFIVEGLDSFGMRLIKWLIDEGVTKLFVVSKETGKESEEYYLKKLCEHGERLVLQMGVDLTNVKVVQKLLKEASSLGQIGAIFDLQRANKEFLFSSFNSITITQIFNQESRRLCPSLENFVVFEFYNENEASSEVFAMEKVCKQRSISGQHGILILIPNLFKITQSQLQPKAECYLEMVNLLKQLKVLLKMNSSVIFLYHKIVKKSIVIENLEEEDMNEEEYDRKCFEKYLYVQQSTNELFT